MDTTFPKPVSLPGTMLPIPVVSYNADDTSSPLVYGIFASEAAFIMLSSSGARVLLNEYIHAGVLNVPERFDISPFRADDATRIFKVDFYKEDADAHGLPQTMLLEVVAPLNPVGRTESEVANRTFLRERTTIPAQKVYYFDSTGGNSLGLEWMLTSAHDGITLEDAIYNDGPRAVQWPAGRMSSMLTRDELAHILRQVEDHCRELLNLQFNGIGSLYCDWTTREYYVGPLSDWTLSRDRLALQDRQLVEASRPADVQADEQSSGMIHGSLHAGNVLVDPETLDVKCYLGWMSAVIAPREMLRGLLQEDQL